jgi:membrane associated rhomboid family serine protease
MLGPPGQVLDQLGAKDTPRIAYSYQLWRLITPIFLHAGFVHLLTNLIMQLRLAIFLVLWRDLAAVSCGRRCDFSAHRCLFPSVVPSLRS